MTPQAHSTYLNHIKKLLSASFVGWEQIKDKKQLKIVLKEGVFILPFEEGKIITEDTYKDLIQNIFMDTQRFENLYNWMKQTGELKTLMPRATEDWEQDKKLFIEIQKDMEAMANVTDVDLE
jgi:predicted transcriptional regulator